MSSVPSHCHSKALSPLMPAVHLDASCTFGCQLYIWVFLGVFFGFFLGTGGGDSGAYGGGSLEAEGAEVGSRAAHRELEGGGEEPGGGDSQEET